MTAVTRRLAAMLGVATLVLLASGCGGDESDTRVDPDLVDSTEVPDNGLCRMLTPDDVAQPTNATRTVDCAEKHTAETYATGELPGRFAEADYDDPELSAYAYETCSAAFEEFLGADESLVMRSVLSWAWFRPSEKAWDDGARWYRCDVVGGGEQSKEYVALPKTAKGLMLGKPKDDWMVCADGPSVAGSVKVPCSRPHTWRAVTTIKVGADSDPYPGDRLVEVKSRDFCSRSVGGWLGYPDDYDFAYTWFHQAEWDAGNRRSICWARTRK
ncbi:septum formation family protein [Nocardioides daejeonensis]|uniref:septum formation family protein n=1 Tax=Nocardioides daejeonensis TaxID=1046556 RepID=UPI001EF601E0|nr:septum formation family protein [Nocardioides daejeonensis]